MNEQKLRRVIREMIKKELQEKALTPFQKKVKALFDKHNGTVPESEIQSLVKGHGDEWHEMIDKSYVGRKPGEKVWHWV